MTNEEFVRQAYALAEAKDIQGWIDCFTPDGIFVDNSVGVDLHRSGGSGQAGRILRCGLLGHAP